MVVNFQLTLACIAEPKMGTSLMLTTAGLEEEILLYISIF